MEFSEVVRRRHMVRRFTGEPVSPQSLDRILRNAVRGPNAEAAPRDLRARRRPAEDVIHYGRW